MRANRVLEVDVVVRAGTVVDMERILDLGFLFWGQLDYPHRYDREQARESIMYAFRSGLVAVLEREDDGVVVGFIAAVLIPLVCHPDKQATEIAYYVLPEFRGKGLLLLRLLEQMARDRGATYLTMISMQCHNPKAAERIYGALGYQHVESSYRKEL